MSGRDQPVPGGNSEPGAGYTSNPYDAHEVPNHPTERLSTAGHQPPQWGYPAVPTPPYGEALPIESMTSPPSVEPPLEAPPEPKGRGPLWPWLVGSIGLLVVAIVGSTAYYLSAVGSDLNNDAKLNTTVVSLAPPPATGSTSPTFVPRFAAFSGTVQSNDGTTMVVAPKDGAPPVTVITNAQTQVLLGGGQGIAVFKPGDGVFVQGSTQQDGKVVARMIIGSLFGN